MKSALDMNQVSTLSTVLLTNLDENVFFSKISDFVNKQFGEYKAQVFEAFEDGSTQLKAENGKVIESGLIYEKGQGLSGYVSRMKRAYYSNSKRDPLLATTKRAACVESELCVPINCEGMILGTIHIQSKKEDRKFSEADVEIVRNILEQLESPLKNLKMYLIAKHLNRELQGKIEQKEEELKQRGPIIGNKTGAQDKIEIIGHSNAIMQVNNIAQRIAAEDFPVMIVGESGAGKKLLARKIHSLSSRSGGECHIVHCSAIEESQIEVELFGTQERPGLFEKANHGTLILDCVEELSLNIQAKVLRTLLSGEIYKVNSNTPVKVNVRVVSTNKQSLDQAVEEGRFREDLIYRLNIVKIDMPSLQERKDDIKVLSEFFMNQGKDKEDYKILTTKAVEKLVNYKWPGNIQELRNVMERTYILAEDRYVDEHHLPNLAQEAQEEEAPQESFSEMTLHELEKAHIIRSLEHLGGNKTRAAKTLGITVKTLYNKLHSYGLVQPKSE
ncbi:MAG: sigma-54-dependent Fis family transcriptional regulator [Bacteriovoracaceae bacterium]